MSQALYISGLTALALSNVVYFFGGSPGSVQQGPGEESTVRIEEVLEPDELPLCQCPPVPTCLSLHELLRQESLEPLVSGIAGKLLERTPTDLLPAGLAGAALTSIASWCLEKCRRARGYGAEAGGEISGFDSASGAGSEAEGWELRVRGLRGGRGTLA